MYHGAVMSKYWKAHGQRYISHGHGYIDHGLMMDKVMRAHGQTYKTHWELIPAQVLGSVIHGNRCVAHGTVILEPMT